NARCPDTADPSARVQDPSIQPHGVGTRVLPAAARADWTTTSGLAPPYSVRKSLTMTGGSPSTITLVLDCSPESTCERPSTGTGTPPGCSRPCALGPA